MLAAAQSWPTPIPVSASPRLFVSEGDSANTRGDAADQIMAIAQRSDQAAFSLLFVHFAPRIKAFLIRRGHAPLAAEELAQEVMLTIWRKAGRFDPARGSGEGWIFTIARNVAIDAQRRDRGQLPLDWELIQDFAEPAQGEEEMIAAEDANLVRSALGSLSSEQRDVIRLSFFDDRPHVEIAETLGLPLGTVKSRLRLAMKRLRSLLEAAR
jgi:RNA polymerase sigma-70 factor (ECF subfamily)